MKQQRKKSLIIGGLVVLFVAIAGIAIGVSLLPEQNDQSPISVDNSEHVGVDKVLTRQQVEKALGDLGTDAQGPELSGTLRTPELRGETASYVFTTVEGKKAIVDVEARIYSSKESLEKSEPFKDTSNEQIADLGVDKARYLLPRSFSADDRVGLVATKNQTAYVFRVEQNANEGVSINQVAAKRIVLRLAKAADYSVVK